MLDYLLAMDKRFTFLLFSNEIHFTTNPRLFCTVNYQNSCAWIIVADVTTSGIIQKELRREVRSFLESALTYRRSWSESDDIPSAT
jgi:hypothetical protein